MSDRGRHLRYTILVIVCGALLPLPLMWLVQPVSGDLTRIGGLPERSFGGNTRQPLIKEWEPSTTANTRLVVIGDSFSWGEQWQQVAFPHEKVRTLTGMVCRDAPQFLAQADHRRRTIIMETVEREFKNRFRSDCVTTSLKPPRRIPDMDSPGEVRSVNLLTGRFGAPYLLGSILYLMLPGEQRRPGDNGGVLVMQVESGCAYWSHRECGLGLFLGADSPRNALPLAEVESPQAGHLSRAGARDIYLLVIPDKSTVYLSTPDEIDAKERYFDTFAQRNGFTNIPLFKMLYTRRQYTRDLYAPNDTHLSNAGYGLVGEHVREYLSRHQHIER